MLKKMNNVERLLKEEPYYIRTEAVTLLYSGSSCKMDLSLITKHGTKDMGRPVQNYFEEDNLVG
jgi:hypothetical protein